MVLHIKNMVCARCIRTVDQILLEIGIPVKDIRLGEVQLELAPSTDQINTFRKYLADEGFELLDERNSKLVERIKNLIINEIHHNARKKSETMNFSTFLAKETLQDYAQLSKLFSTVEGVTIEKFIIAQKIERVKELLVYGELTLTEIAFQTGYSSSQYLSGQFRQVTGLTPTQFKADHQHTRLHLDQL